MIASSGEGLTLGELLDVYETSRRDSGGSKWRKSHKPISAKTLQHHMMVLRYLRHWFGDDQPVSELSALEVEGWIEALSAGKLQSMRTWDRSDHKLPSEQTVGSYIRSARAVFSWCIANRIAHHNPFDDFSGYAGEPQTKMRYVYESEADALCRHATCDGWAMLIRLCRYAGLRRGEALALRWQDIDWDRHRAGFTSVKTGRYREVPLQPKLYRLLLSRLDAVSAGEHLVARTSESTLFRRALRTMKRAGLAEWAKPYQALRASWENDLKEAGVPEPTYLAWMGHSQRVSRQHYVMPVDSEFRRVTG